MRVFLDWRSDDRIAGPKLISADRVFGRPRGADGAPRTAILDTPESHAAVLRRQPTLFLIDAAGALLERRFRSNV
jgi:hypothetical protein